MAGRGGSSPHACSSLEDRQLRILATWRRRCRTLATIFQNLFGLRAFVVDSLATPARRASHTAHFVSDFQFNFGQFSLAFRQSAS
jgi:hypothetical protein